MTRITDEMVEAARLEIAPYRCPRVMRAVCAKGGDCQCRTICRRALEAALAVETRPPRKDEWTTESWLGLMAFLGVLVGLWAADVL